MIERREATVCVLINSLLMSKPGFFLFFTLGATVIG